MFIYLMKHSMHFFSPLVILAPDTKSILFWFLKKYIFKITTTSCFSESHLNVALSEAGRNQTLQYTALLTTANDYIFSYHSSGINVTSTAALDDHSQPATANSRKWATGNCQNVSCDAVLSLRMMIFYLEMWWIWQPKNWFVLQTGIMFLCSDYIHVTDRSLPDIYLSVIVKSNYIQTMCHCGVNLSVLNCLK